VHLVRRFANSLLQCLRVMYREKIIHCDLKPVRTNHLHSNKKQKTCFFVLFRKIFY